MTSFIWSLIRAWFVRAVWDRVVRWWEQNRA